MSHGSVRRCAELLAVIFLAVGAHGADVHVDDDAPYDPGQRDPEHSDPLEDGSPEHPFDAIQEAIDAARDGDTVVVHGGYYAGIGNNSLVIDQAGGAVLSVVGIDGSAETLIDCERIAYGLRVLGDPDDTGHTAISGLTVENAFATVGAGLEITSAARAAVLDCVIRGCVAADNGGGLSITDGSVVTIVDSRFEGNVCQDSGGGANVTSSEVTFQRCRFVGNESMHLGGGCLLRQSTVVLRDCLFDTNVANQGGGLHSFANSTTVIGCEFTGNRAVQGTFAVIGGGANFVGSTATVTDSAFSDNSADFRGGGMMVTFSAEYGAGSITTTTGCTFYNNTAEDGGGAFVTASEGRFEDCDFIVNLAEDDGGAIGASAGDGVAPTVATVSGGSYVDNNAGDDGGAIFLRLSYMSVTGAEFTENTAGGSGGAVFVAWSPDVLVDACTFQWNGARRGGAAHVQNATGRFTGCDFGGNTATGNGGAVSLDSAWITVLGSSLADNFAGDEGGATYATDATLDLVSSVLEDNHAEDGGGGSCYALFTRGDVINCIYSNNDTPAHGGAIRLFDGPTIDLDCVTIADNAAAAGGAIASDDEGTPSFIFVNNSILWGNAGSVAHRGGDSDVGIEYSCVEGGWIGDGNIETDPLFRDAIDADYHLTSGSSCVDVGDEVRLPLDELDLDGDGDVDERLPVDLELGLRVVQGRDGSRPRLDMGAYEFQLPGDFERDGVVGFDDLLVVLGNWGPCPEPCPPICPGDGNSDCLVNFEDLLLVLSNWS